MGKKTDIGKKARMLTIADILFTVFCLVAVICWYMHIPYRIEVTGVLAVLVIAIFIYSQKGLESEEKFIESYSELLQDETCFRSAFDYSENGMALLSKHGHCLKVNYALCQILGFHEDELLKKSIRKLIHPEDFKINIQKIRSMLKGEIKSYQAMQRFFTKNNETMWAMVTFSFVHDKENKPLYFVIQFQNDIAMDNSADHLPVIKGHELLTGLCNRTLLNQHLNELISTSTENKQPFALLLLDLDALRNINAGMSYEAGDTLLKIVAERLKNTIRSADMIARIGGDEFAIVIKNAEKLEVIGQIAQKILSGLLRSITINGREIFITGSIGVGLYPNDGKDVEALIRSADQALLRVKQAGGNHYQFFLPEATELSQKKSKQLSALNQAMAKNELQLYYQPCINLADQTIISVEALVRWQSSEYGLVMPNTIIPLAEESGLIFPLSEWVLRTACKQVNLWRTNGYPDLKLSINLSPYQFKNSNFMENVLRALKESDFPPALLSLEITEGLFMHDHENTIAILKKIKAAGVSIVIDDFGTGFSSLSYMTRYGIDKIKIDRSFIHKMIDNKDDEVIVSAMISMANKLGIKAVAEGVETKEQYDLLMTEGCDEMQGYYIAKPMPIELMETYLAKKKPASTKTNKDLP